MRSGTSFGIPTELEVTLAELIVQRMPHLEMLRFVSSGTEATMSAVRLARAATKRDVLLKFDGCYHGHADSFLVRAGSGVATLGLPNSPGVPASLASLTLTAPFNDLDAVERVLACDTTWPRLSSSRSWETAASSLRTRCSFADFAPWRTSMVPFLCSTRL